ncbi:UTRA domain-containing protein [Arthrobacter antioxidans]|uniref:UTRA domain-containing protein n=1 Tax=Arthrobacter antioxidans TaxID=2895818 RepID=UPI0020000CD8|nr:UTRA domain-containing protein [Arthrobacter antioxidans]
MSSRAAPRTFGRSLSALPAPPRSRVDQELLRLLKPAESSPVLLLEGASFDQHGRPVEVFSTWHHPDHVVFDIDIQSEPAGRAPADGLPSSPATDAPGAGADRARRLGADLLHFADDLSRNGS